MGELTLQIYRAAPRRWSGIVSDDGSELTGIVDCASPREVAATVREQFPLIRVVQHPQTSARVVAALEGRGDANVLDADESELFAELFGEALSTPTAETRAFVAKLRE